MSQRLRRQGLLYYALNFPPFFGLFSVILAIREMIEVGLWENSKFILLNQMVLVSHPHKTPEG